MRWSGIPLSFKNVPVCCETHSQSLNVVSALLGFPCFFCDLTNVGNLIIGSSAFSKCSLYLWKFSNCLEVHELLKPSLKDFEHYCASM